METASRKNSQTTRKSAALDAADRASIAFARWSTRLLRKYARWADRRADHLEERALGLEYARYLEDLARDRE